MATQTLTPATAPATGMSAESAASLTHMAAVAGLVAAPLILAMPPRKLDLYTFAVAGIGVYCGNHLVRENNGGVGLMGLAGRRFGLDTTSASSSSLSSTTSLPPSHAHEHANPRHESALERFSLPTERARNLHEALAQDRDAAEERTRRYNVLAARADRLATYGWGVGGDMREALSRDRRQVEEDARRHGWTVPPRPAFETQSKRHASSRRSQALASAVGLARAGDETRGGEEAETEEGGVSGMVKRVWMGGETEGWKERRLREEQQALDEGKTYSDMILDQIWEVWNWDKRKDEDGNWVPKTQSKEQT